MSSQAIRKRGDLLRELALLQAREDIKGKVAEVAHFDSMVKKLKARYPGHTERKNRKRKKATIFRTQIQQVNQELQNVQEQSRGTR